MDLKVGDVVVYSCQGVCRLERVLEREVGGKKLPYYLLKPVYNNRSAIFVPVTNISLTKKIHPVMTKEEALIMLKSLDKESGLWIENELERKERYHQIMVDGSFAELASVIVALYNQRELRAKEGKRLHVADERVLKEAQKLLSEQLAYALELKLDDLPQYILANFMGAAAAV